MLAIVGGNLAIIETIRTWIGKHIRLLIDLFDPLIDPRRQWPPHAERCEGISKRVMLGPNSD